MKPMSSVVIAKPSSVHRQAFLCALLLAAAQHLAAQTSIQGSVDVISNLTSGGQDGLAFFLAWSAPSNGVYLVQSSTNLADPGGWTTEDAVDAQVGPVRWMAPESLQQAKFYRLVTPQTQIFSAQPSVMPAGTGQTVVLAGQSFPQNATVLINGVVATGVTVADSSDILVAFSPTVPGTYDFQVAAAGTVLSSAVVTVYDPSAPPAFALQEPPEDPPGSPVTPSEATDVDVNTGRVRFRVVSEAGAYDAFLVAGDKSRLQPGAVAAPPGHNPLNRPAYLDFACTFVNGRYMLTAGVPLAADKSRYGLAAQDTDGNGGLDRLAEGCGLVPPNGSGGGSTPEATLLMPALLKAKEKANSVYHGGGGGSSQKATLLMPALMKAKEKANQVKCGVAPSSGEVQAQATDLAIPGVGLDFVWTRTYRSRTGPQTALGHRWDFSYDIACQTNNQGITVFDGGGRQDTYQAQGKGVFACPGCFRQGAMNNLSFQLTFADGGYWAFLPFDGSVTAGKIARIVDRNGNTLSFQYNTLGQLAAVVDTLGRTNTLAYSTGGQLEALTDFAGRTVTYQYYAGGGGPAGDLESVTSPPVAGTPNGNDFPSGKTTTYTYSSGYTNDAENHFLLTVTDPLGQTAHVFSYQHSSSDFNYLRCIQEQCGNPGQVLTYDWEPQTPQPGQYAVIKCIVNDAVGNVSEYYYDSLNRPLRELDYTGRATPGVTTTDTANRPANPLRSTDPTYFETDWQWNDDSLCTLETEPGGGSIQCVYQGDLNPNTPARFRANMVIRRRRVPHDDTAEAALWPEGLETYYQYDPRFGTEPTMTICLDAHTKRITPSGDDTVAASGDHASNMSGNHKDCMTAASGHTGQMIGNHKDCMMVASGHTGQMIGNHKDCMTAVSGHTGQMIGNHKDSMICSFPVNITDPGRNQTAISYDASGNLIHLQHNGSIPVAGENTIAPEDFTYNGAGQLTSHTLPDNGNGYRRTDQAAYYAGGAQQGYLQSVTVDAGGANETTTLQYDPYGNVVRCVDPLGNDTLYAVNALDEVVQEQSPMVSTTVAVRYTNEFTYDADDNLVSVTTPGIGANGTADATVTGLTAWTYDILSCVTSETDRIDNAHNAVTQYQYDANRNVTNIILPEAANGDDPFNTVSCQYDERNLPFKVVRGPGSPLESTDQLNVTLDGQISQITSGLEAGPEVDNFFYDGFDRLIALQDAMGNVATNGLDANGDVVLQTFLGPTNQTSGAANVLLAQTAFTYDNLNRVTQSASAFFDLTTGSPVGSGQSITSITYSDLGGVTSLTDPRGNPTRAVYDNVGRVSSVTDAGGNGVQYAYDNNDNVVLQTETDQSGPGGPSQVFVLTNRYDNLDRPTANSDNVGNTCSFAYNSRDDLALWTDARGHDIFYQYDGLNRCTAAIMDLNGDGIPDLGDVETQTGYDADSRMIAFTDNNGNTTSHTYDSLNRETKTTSADGSFGTNGYDPHDNVVMSADQNSTVLSHTYDLLNRRTGTTVLAYGGGTAATSTFETFAYDGLSRLTQWANDAAACTAAYDSLGDCVRESMNGRTTSSSYDATGNRLTLTHPDGVTVSYAYDSLNRQTNVSGGGALVETLAYAGPDRLASRQYANGTSSLYYYDGAVGTTNAPGDYGWGQVSDAIQLPATSGSGTPAMADWALQYDPNGNKTGRNQTATFGTGGSTQGPQQQFFSYDPLNRLTNAGVFSGTTLKRLTQYALDGVGNRTNVGGYNNTCDGAYTLNATTPGPDNFKLNEYATTGCDSRQYNSNRDLTAITSTGAGVSLAYDFRDQLVSITNPGAGTGASYAYDALGRRIQKTVNAPGVAAQVTTYFYDGGDVIEEQNGAGVEQAGYVLDDTGIVSMSRSGQTYYFHADELGNVLDLTDTNGNVTERYDYDDYGQPQFLSASGNPEGGATGPATQSLVGNPYLFQSFQWDAESGFYHLTSEGMVHRDLSTRNTLLSAGVAMPASGRKWEDDTVVQVPPAMNPLRHGLAEVEKIHFKQEFGPTVSSKRSECLDPRSGRTITASDKGGENPLYEAGKGLAPSGNAFEFEGNNPWSAGTMFEQGDIRRP
jgi:YD repeat-containing protein